MWFTKWAKKESKDKEKKKDFSPDFISYQAQLYLVEGNRQVVLNKIPIVFNTENVPKIFEEFIASRDSTF